MKKQSWTAGIAILLALVGIVTLVCWVAAEELSPPYVIVLRPWSFNAYAVAVDPIHNYAYIAADEGVAIIKELTLTHTINLPPVSHIATDSELGYAYLTHYLGYYVTVLQGTGVLTQVFIPDAAGTGGDTTGALAVLTSTHYVYAAVFDEDWTGNDRVAILDRTKLVTQVVVGEYPRAIVANPVTGYVYVVNTGYHTETVGTVSVIQGTKVVATLNVGHYPIHAAVNPVTGYVYVSNFGDDTVSVIQGTSVVATISDIHEPYKIATNPRNGHVYVISNNTSDIQNPRGWVEVLSGVSKLGVRVALSADGRAIAVNPNSGYVYVSNGSGDTAVVTILSDTLALETFPMHQTAPDIAINTNPKIDLAYVPIYDGHVAVFGRTRVFGSDVLGPGSSDTVLKCYNVQAGTELPIEIRIPAGAIRSANTRVLCIPLDYVDAAPYYVWGRQGLRLVVAENGVNISNYTFNHPLQIGMVYLTGLPAPIEEEELEVRRYEWSGLRWDWSSSGVQKIAQPLLNPRWYTVTVQSVGDYSLVWHKHHLYLPLVTRKY